MKVLLAEDSALLRAGLCQLLRAMGHHVVEVGDADTLLQAGRFSDIEGLAVVHELRRERLAEGRPVLPVIVLSQYVAAAYLDRLLDYGAFGYLLKERVSDVAEFSRALVDVVAGGTVVDPEVTRALVGAASDGLAMLTDRERDVLELMAQGLSNSQIGERLFLSRSGVSKHVANVFIKLGFDPTDDNRRVRAVLVWLRREGIHRAPSKLLEPR